MQLLAKEAVTQHNMLEDFCKIMMKAIQERFKEEIQLQSAAATAK